MGLNKQVSAGLRTHAGDGYFANKQLVEQRFLLRPLALHSQPGRAGNAAPDIINTCQHIANDKRETPERKQPAVDQAADMFNGTSKVQCVGW